MSGVAHDVHHVLDDRAIHETLLALGREARRELLVESAMATLILSGGKVAALSDDELVALTDALLERFGDCETDALLERGDCE